MSDKYYHITLQAKLRISPYSLTQWTLVIDKDPLDYLHDKLNSEKAAKGRGEKTTWKDHCILYDREISKEEYDKHSKDFS